MKISHRILLILWSFALHFCSTCCILSLAKNITEWEVMIMVFLPLILIVALQPLFCKAMNISAWDYYVNDFAVVGAMAFIGFIVFYLSFNGMVTFWYVLIMSAIFFVCLISEVVVVCVLYGLIKLYKCGTVKGIIGTVVLIATIAIISQSLFIGYKYYQIDSEYAAEVIVGQTQEKIINRYGEPEQRFPKEEQESFSGTFFYEKGEDTYEITFENGVAVKYKIGYRD